jgi:hypothetical protein
LSIVKVWAAESRWQRAVVADDHITERRQSIREEVEDRPLNHLEFVVFGSRLRSALPSPHL